ncbi:MAG: short-chain dehydrogenase/reductase [Pseudanabaena frigida]|uniref:Short-chain dehydrogenase/reductase n=1 Tax=Pseudanabaena frigida TaxID=945775 RepID=A0A2W4W0L0_9CYAN|nr:MAG: short-chain dehydrogenase/reductase [Pseudanabaena frigida]
MGQTVLITGASSGIGEATAKYFLQKGWNVAATMRSLNKANLESNKSIIFPRLDVTDPETINAAIAQTLEHFGQIDALVNNAGYALMGPIEGVTTEQLQQQFQTNVFGVVSTMQAILPIFRQQKSGTIINVASVGGRIGFPMTASYHGTKWAVEGISEAMRFELEPLGIRIKIIEPGGIKTNFINHGVAWAIHPEYKKPIAQVQKFMYKINDSLPDPDGVAKAIYRAATDRSQRLRYSPHGEMFLLLHSLLPDLLWRSLVKTLMLGT